MTAGASAPPPVAAPGRRSRRAAGPGAVRIVLVLLAGSAWLATDRRMAGMAGRPGEPLGSFAFFVVTWVVMMVAMMFPSAAPMVAMYAGIQQGRRRRGLDVWRGATACFVGGYLAVWTAAGAVTYAAVALARRWSLVDLSWGHGGRWLAAAALLAAAAYEVTPLKQRCLLHCRSPLAFVLAHWRRGRAGAVRMGGVHGLWCLGCCWALMAALFALGIMSLAWMALVTALIAAEKLLPWRRVAVGLVAGLLALLAVGVAAGPQDVPGLVVDPGAPMGSMK